MYVVKLDMNLGLSLGWLFVILLPLKLIVVPFVTCLICVSHHHMPSVLKLYFYTNKIRLLVLEINFVNIVSKKRKKIVNIIAIIYIHTEYQFLQTGNWSWNLKHIQTSKQIVGFPILEIAIENNLYTLFFPIVSRGEFFLVIVCSIGLGQTTMLNVESLRKRTSSWWKTLHPQNCWAIPFYKSHKNNLQEGTLAAAAEVTIEQNLRINYSITSCLWRLRSLR